MFTALGNASSAYPTNIKYRLYKLAHNCLHKAASSADRTIK